MSEAPFDPTRFLTKIPRRAKDANGRWYTAETDYLEVKYRLLWLRTDHPDAVVETDVVEHSPTEAVFRARCSVPGGGSATGWGHETAADFEDYVEKAETKALGRALAALGYGTQFCEDWEASGGAAATKVAEPLTPPLPNPTAQANAEAAAARPPSALEQAATEQGLAVVDRQPADLHLCTEEQRREFSYYAKLRGWTAEDVRAQCQARHGVGKLASLTEEQMGAWIAELKAEAHGNGR